MYLLVVRLALGELFIAEQRVFETVLREAGELRLRAFFQIFDKQIVVMLALRQQPVAESPPVVDVRRIHERAAQLRNFAPSERIYARDEIDVAFYLHVVSDGDNSSRYVHRQDFFYAAHSVAKIAPRFFERLVRPQVFAYFILRHALLFDEHEREDLRFFEGEDVRRPVHKQFRPS